MNFSFLVARRYLLAKKSHNAVNVISAVSVIGVAIGTMALVIVMSVFNGFEDLARKLYSNFDPDLKITASVGKSFVIDAEKLQFLEEDADIFAFSQTIEENVLVQYGEQQEIAVVKGVDDQYQEVTGIDQMILDGKYQLWINENPQAVVGAGMAAKLHIGLHFITPIRFFAIRNTGTVSINPEKAVNDRLYIYPSGVFSVDEEIDVNYLLVPLSFARDLLENDSIVGAIEIKVKPGADVENVQKRIAMKFGTQFEVKTAYQQKEFYYRVLKFEKWVGFMILAFVLLIASFNVVSSLSMLMIEKKRDIFIIQGLGADKQLIGRIFIIQGWIIVLAGTMVGLLLGILLCYLQMRFGFVPLSTSGAFIIDAYPVALRWQDFVMVFFAVICISLLTIYFPVKYFVKKYID
ncbi:MAG: ABC transporter permease [Bacteroidales bacterium]|jgi:lipoprotein-releasing system permease protein|nr:ABC transporter permease [Bacteroidales bacterium]